MSLPQWLGGVRWMVLAGVVAGAVECLAADNGLPLGGLSHPHHITYYHPGYFEANGMHVGYGAGYFYSSYYTPVGPYGHAYPYPFPGHYGAPALMLNPSYGPVTPGW